MNPVEFYHQAQRWYTEGNPEESVTARSIVSRAYYAAYHVARREAGFQEDERSEQPAHEMVLNYYYAKDPTLANEIYQLRRLRTDADYRLSRPCERAQARNALTRSRSILIQLDEELPPPPRTRAA